MSDSKPLLWTPKPGIGYTVFRRPDGGMTLVFRDLSDKTLADWHEFASEHLLGSDRLTRNLYDLRLVENIHEKAIKMAVTVNNDPATRNLRVAVVVKDEASRQAILNVAAGAVGAGAAIRVFADLAQAEAWLMKSMEQLA
ncbi:MAG: hypothetical protein Fur0035_06960 [Anaerolineales bacterium]